MIGEGSFGKVELAYHLKTRTNVALKLVYLKHIKNPYVKKNLQREAQILLNLFHPNIVRVIEVCTTSEIYCLSLEYVQGEKILY